MKSSTTTAGGYELRAEERPAKKTVDAQILRYRFLEGEMLSPRDSALIVSLSLFSFLSCCNLAHPGQLAQLTVRIHAQSVQPAGRPILLTLAVTNSGHKPYFYHS